MYDKSNKKRNLRSVKSLRKMRKTSCGILPKLVFLFFKLQICFDFFNHFFVFIIR